MTASKNEVIGSNAAFEIIEAANREMNGETNFLVNEEFFKAKSDEVEIEDFLRTLDKDAIIKAAVEEFRDTFSELLDSCFEEYLEDEA